MTSTNFASFIGDKKVGEKLVSPRFMVHDMVTNVDKSGKPIEHSTALVHGYSIWSPVSLSLTLNKCQYNVCFIGKGEESVVRLGRVPTHGRADHWNGQIPHSYPSCDDRPNRFDGKHLRKVRRLRNFLMYTTLLFTDSPSIIRRTRTA